LNGSGVILALTAQVARSPYPNVGGFGVACAAIEGFCRQLAAEVGPQGIRVVCLRSAGSYENDMKKLKRTHMTIEVKLHGK
jgi:3-oxoacyl-[acyl-carrier protein] reductase